VVTRTLENALWASAAMMSLFAVLGLVLAVIQRSAPKGAEVLACVITTATVITVSGMVLQAYLPGLYDSVGVYFLSLTPAAMVFGLVVAHPERSAARSITGGLVAGAVFSVIIIADSFFREILGTGSLSLFGQRILSVQGLVEHPVSIFTLPMGAFLVLGLVLIIPGLLGLTKNE
jgi:electron transport complex protein RnfE